MDLCHVIENNKNCSITSGQKPDYETSEEHPVLTGRAQKHLLPETTSSGWQQNAAGVTFALCVFFGTMMGKG